MMANSSFFATKFMSVYERNVRSRVLAVEIVRVFVAEDEVVVALA